MAVDAWRNAFEQVRAENHYVPLNELLGLGSTKADGRIAQSINDSFEWDGAFLTPLFVAVLLRLDDHLPHFFACGADVNVQCLFDGFLCGPLHVAALQGDCGVLSALLKSGCDANASGAETSVLETPMREGEGASTPATGELFFRCNALHVLIIRDVFSKDVYSLLLAYGAKLTASCTVKDGSEVSGLSLPHLLGNKQATEANLDEVLHEELRHTIQTSRLASELNAFLELGSVLRRDRPSISYNFIRGLDFRFPPNQEGEQLTPVLFAADVGNSDALRLLLYAGADSSISLQRMEPFRQTDTLTLNLNVLHVAALRGDLPMIEQLLFFGITSDSPPCHGSVHSNSTLGEGDSVEHWRGLDLLHLAVLKGRADKLSGIIELKCDINQVAERIVGGSGPEFVSPLHFAVLCDDVDCTAKLLDLGAAIDDQTKAAALERRRVCEMFGGPPVVGLDEWLEALLTGEEALRHLICRRTDLSRVFDFPEFAMSSGSAEALAARFEKYRLVGPELRERLVKSFEEAPTVLQELRPIHLACLLQQPWAIEILAAAGVSVCSDGPSATPPCLDVPRHAMPLPGSEGHSLSHFPLDLVFLCVRTGSMQVLELLIRHPQFAFEVNREIPLAPDLTPSFYPRRHSAGDDYGLTWAWRGLGLLEFAILHRRVDVAVLLCRLGINMLHTVDHASVGQPSHYSVTDYCYRGLTPLHLCALLDFRLAAAALLHEAADDKVPIVSGEYTKAQRQEILSAAACKQCWVSVASDANPNDEPWLWSDMTPLHLAIVCGNVDIAELLVDSSGPNALNLVCLSYDAERDSERSFSPLLLAFEKGYKDLHRRIARKFPSN